MKYSNKLNILIKQQSTVLMLFLLVAISSSCKKDWLEAKSDKKLAVPETVKDFQAMLDYNLIVNSTNLSRGEVAADGHYYTGNDFNAMLSSNPSMQNAYTWSDLNSYQLILSDSEYNAAYANILNMNIILDRVEKSKDNDAFGLKHVKAQALFHRACYLFELSGIYAPQYELSTADKSIGIALRLSTDVTERSVRSTIRQTFDQIISDLEAASDVLPEVPEFLTRPSKSAALGMLAKVYLTIGDHTNAFNYANEYLKFKSQLLDYTTILPGATYIGVNKEVSFLKFFPAFGRLTSQYLIDQSLYDSYNTNDLRKQTFFNVTSAGITFKGTYGNNVTDLFSGIATDEMYLIRAEGYARSGNLSAAMKDLNDLLRTRWAKNLDGSTKYVDQTASDETDALRKIFSERKKQLILRNVRWSDLRRLNLDDRFKTTLSRSIGGQTYTLEPNSYKYTFPIPNDVIRLSGMAQNPGW